MRLLVGENVDEYDPEINAILVRLPAIHSSHQLQRLIHKTFVEYFAPLGVGSEAKYEALARDVWQAWHQRAASR